MNLFYAPLALLLATGSAAGEWPEPVFHPARPSAAALALFNSGVPSVTLAAGPAYRAGDRLFFTAVYAVYYPPKGIARFPDGGRAAQAFAAVYLYEALPGGQPPRLAAEIGRCDAFQDARSTMLYRDGELIIRFSSPNPRHVIEGGARLGNAHYYAYAPAAGRLHALGKAPDWPVKYPRADSDAHRDFFRTAGADLRALGLPSPLAYIRGDKGDSRLKDIFLAKEGSDRLLRLEVLRHWLRTGKRALAEGTVEELKASLPGVPALKRYLAEEDIQAAENILSTSGQK
jgi:hypothetical protein